MKRYSKNEANWIKPRALTFNNGCSRNQSINAPFFGIYIYIYIIIKELRIKLHNPSNRADELFSKGQLIGIILEVKLTIHLETDGMKLMGPTCFYLVYTHGYIRKYLASYA